MKKMKHYIKKIIKKLLYSLISTLDKIEYKCIYKEKLLDGYKTTKDIDISKYGIKILTDDGFQSTSHIYNTKPFVIYNIRTESGKEIQVADKHMLFEESYNKTFYNIIYTKDIIPNETKIITIDGPELVTSVLIEDNISVSMSDITVDHPNHRFYSNGILSHNSVTTAIFCLWTILFHTDKMALLLSKSGPAGVDLLSKIKDMYRSFHD